MKFINIFITSLRKLTFKNFKKLLKLSLCNPIFALLTFTATIQTYKISKKYYPITSSTDGKGNAFRHALWCCLILAYCCKISSPRKCFEWCKKITDFNEEIFPNDPLQRKMDLHNNTVGIQYFESLLPTIHRQFFETSFFIKKLLEKTEKAIFIKNFDEEVPNNQLMYIKK